MQHIHINFNSDYIIKSSCVGWGEFFLFHFPLAAEGLGGEFDFVVAVGFVHLVDDAHEGLVLWNG